MTFLKGHISLNFYLIFETLHRFDHGRKLFQMSTHIVYEMHYSKNWIYEPNRLWRPISVTICLRSSKIPSKAWVTNLRTLSIWLSWKPFSLWQYLTPLISLWVKVFYLIFPNCFFLSTRTYLWRSWKIIGRGIFICMPFLSPWSTHFKWADKYLNIFISILLLPPQNYPSGTKAICNG